MGLIHRGAAQESRPGPGTEHCREEVGTLLESALLLRASGDEPLHITIAE